MDRRMKKILLFIMLALVLLVQQSFGNREIYAKSNAKTKQNVVKRLNRSKNGKIDGESKVKLVAESEAKSDLDAISGADPGTDSTTDPEPDPNPDPDPGTDSTTDPEPDPNPNPDPDPEPTPDPNPDPNPEPDPSPEPDPDPNPDPNPSPDPDPKPNPDPTPEPEPVSRYELKVPKTDGNNGYYWNYPKVQLTHTSKSGTTYYRVTGMNGVLSEGKLEQKDEKIELSENAFGEGANTLKVWMEDADGKELKEYSEERILLIDSISPAGDVRAENGFDNWYQGKARIYVTAEDAESGIEKVECFAGGKFIGETTGSAEKCFQISEVSVGGAGIPVLIRITDVAGNCTEEYRTLYIDSGMPEIEIDGVANRMITGSKLVVRSIAKDENGLSRSVMRIECEYPDGTKRTLIEDVWNETESGREISAELTEDGIYKIYCEATDLAGHQKNIYRQVIIDQSNPVIREIEQLDKKYYQKFSLDISPEEWIYDFTSYTYMLLLDGKVYIPGKEILEEGWHTLTLQVRDAAGNVSKARAIFKVDHTAPDIVIHGVEANKRYEEMAAFQISIKNEEDEMEYISINGERQPLNYLGDCYKYAVREPGYYELEVCASDKAGNKAIRRLRFEVQEKKAIMEKMMSPVKKTVSEKVFSPIKRIWNKVTGQDERSGSQENLKKEGKINDNTAFAGKRRAMQSMMLVGVLICAGGAWWNRKKK